MLDLRPEDTIHKSILNRLFIEIVDQPVLSQGLAFKGGTCAAMLGYLDRFSVDLDFDVLIGADETALRVEFRRVFDHLGLAVVREFEKGVLFQLRYANDPGKRSTLKVSASNLYVNANQYQVQYFPEVDRLMNSQTIETMFANKLVAITDRFRMHATIAGRDIYDVHHFFTRGFAMHAPVIQERTGLSKPDYLAALIDFIKQHFTERKINEDLNALLPYPKFQHIRKILLPETLAMLAREQAKPG